MKFHGDVICDEEDVSKGIGITGPRSSDPTWNWLCHITKKDGMWCLGVSGLGWYSKQKFGTREELQTWLLMMDAAFNGHPVIECEEV